MSDRRFNLYCIVNRNKIDCGIVVFTYESALI